MTPAISKPISYLWQGPGKHLKVSLSLEVVGLLESAISEVVQSQSWRPLEVGGLLLGTRKRRPGAMVVEIHGFEPLRCEHAFGPSYLLSPADRAVLERRRKWHKENGRARERSEVIGFYRTHTRQDFAATVEDADLMSAHFPEPWNLFLLIHAIRGVTPTAGFVIWEGGKLQPKTPYGRFPFSVAALTNGAASPKPETTPAATVDQPHVDPTPSVALLQFRRGMSAFRSLMTAAVVRNRIHLAELGGVLRTRAIRAQQGTIAQWNRLRRGAANLWIRQRFPLGAKLVAVSTAIVAALSVAIVFRHSAFGTRSLSAEAHRGTNAASRTPPVAVPLTAGAVTPDVPAPTIEHAVDPAPTAKPPAGNATARVVSSDRREPDFLSDGGTAKVTPATPAELPDPPDIPVATAPDMSKIASWENENLSVAMVPRANPLVRITIDPEQHPDRGGVFNRVFGKRHVRADFTPARLLNQAPPELPATLRSRLQHDLRVDVKVYLDSTGKVQYSELLSDGRGENKDFATLAVFSARHCLFAPAQVGSETVPASVVLRFQFGPNAE